ncbi:hypothetical protein N9W05_03175, partial [Alphaproteobacteria bacterium]|nr:hypothetical protein [Alphaproteobacteria bacterium]
MDLLIPKYFFPYIDFSVHMPNFSHASLKSEPSSYLSLYLSENFVFFSTIDRYYSLSFEVITFIDFLVPGLIVMTVAQESFDNPSVSIINSKQIGSFD